MRSSTRSQKLIAGSLIPGLLTFPIIPALRLDTWRFVSEAQAAELVRNYYLRIEVADTLSEALYYTFPHLGGHLWGRKGAVAKVAALNPQIPNIHRLRPGMLVFIGNIGRGAWDPGRKIASTSSPTEGPKAEEAPPIIIPSKTKANAAAQPVEAPSASDEGDARFGFFEFRTGFYYSRIDSVDRRTLASATFLSSASPSFNLTWGQHWSRTVETGLTLGLRKETYEYQTPSGTTQEISNTLVDFGGELRFKPIENHQALTLIGDLGFRRELFSRAISATTQNLDPVLVPEIAVGPRYRLADLEPFRFDVFAQGLLLLPTKASTYNVNFGKGYVVGGTLTQQVTRRLAVTGDLWYTSKSQDSSIATQSRSDIGFSLGLSWRFDAFTPEDKKGGSKP